MIAPARTAYTIGMYARKLELWSKYIDCRKDYHKKMQNGSGQDGEHKQYIPTLAERFPVKFLIEHSNWCKEAFEGIEPPYGLIIVISAPKHSDARQAIRETWGKNSDGIDNFKTIFFLGRSKDEKTQKTVIEENNQYGDVVIADFVEDYYNLTLKSFGLIQWVHQYCSIATYTVKIDDDCLLNKPAIVNTLQNSPRTKFYFGDTFVGTRPIRDIWNKWYTPEEAWNDTYYPPYSSGVGYVMSFDVISGIYNLQQPFDFIPWEDVMIGILISKLDDVTPVPDKRVNSQGVYRHPCTIRDALIVHEVSPQELKKYWYILFEQDACSISKRNYLISPSVESKAVPRQEEIERKQPRFTMNELGIKYKCDKETFIVLFVFSEPHNYQNRKYARMTWAKIRYTGQKHVKTIFVMGETSMKNVRSFINNEANVEGDIIILNTNATEKSLISMNSKEQLKLLGELQRHLCPTVSYVMKIDEDVFVNLVKVVDFVKNSPPSNIVVGQLGNPSTATESNISLIINANNQFETLKSVFILSSTLLLKVNTLLSRTIHDERSQNHNDMSEILLQVNRGIIVKQAYNQKDFNSCHLHKLLAIQNFEGGIMLRVAFVFNDNSFFSTCNVSDSDVMLAAFRSFTLTEKLPEIYMLSNNWLFARTIDPFEYEFTINKPTYCRSGSSLNIFLVVLVLTDPGEFDRRTALRSSWFGQDDFEDKSIKYLFVTGKSGDDAVNDKVRYEDKNHGDIIQINILHNAKNSTVQTVMSFKWISKFCLHTKFVVMIKAYMFLNVRQVVDYLGNLYLGTENFIIGNVCIDCKPIRSNNNFYFTPKSLYPQEMYPRYPISQSYVMSSEVAHKLFLTSRETPLFPWDDVYVGIVLQKLGITPYHHQDFLSKVLPSSSDFCQLQSFMSWKTDNIDQIPELWKILQEPKDKESCPKPKTVHLKEDNFLIPNSHICNDTVDELELLLVIISKPDNIELRHSIRETWAMAHQRQYVKDKSDKDVMKHVFVIAKPQAHGLYESLITESRDHHDVILLDFDDSYKTLVFKTIMALKWVSLFCKNVNYVMKLQISFQVQTSNSRDLGTR
ncbi:uncharacterized protein LOC144452801 [Glandiceps talaboti]